MLHATWRPLAAMLVLPLFGCGGSGAPTCADATIHSNCATLATGPCRDAHGNTCIVCDGAHVIPGCIYDPYAPFDGGTAVCVARCTDCGSACLTQ